MASAPSGAQRPGCIGLIGGKIPIANFPNAAAICNGPVLQATSPSALAIKLINSIKDSFPERLMTSGCLSTISDCMIPVSDSVPDTNILNLSFGSRLISSE